MITAHAQLHSANFGSRSSPTPSCTTTTLTDIMPNRFLVPALITGMILTVRIAICFQTKPIRIVCSAGRLQLPLVEVPGNGLYSLPEPILMLQSVQDMQCVENCDDPDPKRHVLYEQPVWQTLQMFRTSPHHISSPYPPIRLHIHTSDFSSQLEKCSVCPLALFLLPHISDSDGCFTGTRVG